MYIEVWEISGPYFYHSIFYDSKQYVNARVLFFVLIFTKAWTFTEAPEDEGIRFCLITQVKYYKRYIISICRDMLVKHIDK